MKRDKAFMRLAMAEAQLAAEYGDVPVGAIVVRRGEVIGRGFNRREAWADPTAHAEIVAMRRAAEMLGRWRLEDCTLFVTLEPCLMCAGAIVNARIARLVMGALDGKAGAIRSRYAVVEDPRLNHRVKVSRCLGEPCGQQLSGFFRHLRSRNEDEGLKDE